MEYETGGRDQREQEKFKEYMALQAEVAKRWAETQPGLQQTLAGMTDENERMNTILNAFVEDGLAIKFFEVYSDSEIKNLREDKEAMMQKILELLSQ